MAPRSDESLGRRWGNAVIKQRRMLGPLAIAFAAVLAGCASDPTPTPALSAYFPRHASPLGTGHLALLEGPVVFKAGCIWVQSDPGDDFLILWPSNTTLGMINKLPAVLGPDRELLAETGDVVRLGGNTVDNETAQELVGKMPKACAGEAFWVVSTVNQP
jgi:hypothetical protein